MSYMVFDLETTTTTRHKRKANCFLEENWVVARGWKVQGDARNSYTYHPNPNRFTRLRIPHHVTLLVGFNIKFDLLWELCQGNEDLTAFFKRGGKIWDGQYVEYLLQGQDQKYQMVALDDIIESYGGRKKIDEVKAMWEAGVNTQDIPEDILIDYLVGTEGEDRNSGDIGNTELIFLGQVKRANAAGQIKMIQDRMDGLLSTTYMEFAGIKVDVAEAAKRLKVLKAKLLVAETDLNQYVDDLPFEFNWGSRTQKSCLIFGGTVKYQKKSTYIDDTTGELARLKAKAVHYVLKDGRTTPISPDSKHGPVVQSRIGYVKYGSGKRMGEYKTKQVEVQGELKERLTDFFHTFPGYVKPKDEWKNSATDGLDGPTWSTSSDTMDEVTAENQHITFIKVMQSKDKLDKEIGTYYFRVKDNGEHVGMLTCVIPGKHILHPKLNHTSTVTTRLSASDPNMQNIPRNDLDDDGEQKSQVKAMFVSRFGADGVMIEADYSQLEVVIQGVLSNDPQLCEDLRNKVDFHCKRVSAKFGISYEEALDWCKNELHVDYKKGKKERTKCKIFSFQRAYGAGAVTIALETGMSVDEVKELMELEDRMYPGVVRFNADVESAVQRSSVPFQAANDNGEWKVYRKGIWQAPTGTIYKFRSHDAPAFMQKRGIKDSYSPPELKNYPVQGTGGEFVQAILGLLIRHFIAMDFYGGKAFLVNTVHDCVWVDAHKDVADQVAADVKRIMESIPEFYNTRHGMNITVPFPAEVEMGPNMNSLKHWIPGVPAWHLANDQQRKEYWGIEVAAA